MTLISQIKHQMKTFEQEQNKRYDQLVLPSVLTSDTQEFEKGYQQYIEELNHFDATAYRKAITHILNGPAETMDKFSSQFPYVAEYAVARNNFDQKTKEIFDVEGSQADKQSIFDTLDRRRTNAHNGVIDLFNNLNSYAVEHNIAQPYPNQGKPYDKSNHMDREAVAQVLLQHQPLLENCNHLVQEQMQERKIQSSVEKLRTLTPTETLKAMGVDVDQVLSNLNQQVVQQ